MMVGHTARDVTIKQRGKITKALQAALWIRSTKGGQEHITDDENKSNLARDHYQLFRLLSNHPSVDETAILAGGGLAFEGVKLLSEAMTHVRMPPPKYHAV